MQLGIRVHDGEKLPLEELLPILKNRGFTCGHIALSKSIKEYNTGVSALTPGLAMYLKKLFAQNSLDIAVLGCYLNLANPDSEALKSITEKYMAHIRFASLLGCGVVGTETGAPNIEYKYEPACHSEEALEIFINNLRPVVEYAEKMGVIVAIEPVWKHIVYSPNRARAVLDEISSPNLQIIFDPVNLLCYNNYKERDIIFAEAMELLGKDIAVVHIKDFVVKDNDLVSVAAGKGEISFVMNALSLGIAALYLITLLFVFPVQAIFENPVKKTLKTAFFMALQNLGTSLLLLVVSIGLSYLCYMVPIAGYVFLIVGNGFLTMIFAVRFLVVFRKYNPALNPDRPEECDAEPIKKAERKERKPVEKVRTSKGNRVIK